MNKLAVITFAVLLSACTSQVAAAPARSRQQAVSPHDSAAALERRAAAMRLATAVKMLKRGEATAAAKVLEALSKGPLVTGVSDEALFRLALLSLRKEAGGEELRLLKRLTREFPRSQWTVQAEPLIPLIAEVEELRRQNRALKAANQTLTTEKEGLKKKAQELEDKLQQVNKSLEELKRLDLELEQKAR